MLPADIETLATDVMEELIAHGLTIATAESCTGGLIAGALTAIPGSSAAVYGGFVTYANEAKIAMIGVPYGLLRQFGAVSQPVAMAMAEGARSAAGTHLAVAVTGIAGPDGGTAEKPVGLVHLAVAAQGATLHREQQFDGLDRTGIREATVREALRMILEVIGD